MTTEENVHQLEHKWLHGDDSNVRELSAAIKRNGRITKKVSDEEGLALLKTGGQ